MKRIVCKLLSFMLLLTSLVQCASAESILPSLDKLFGISGPNLDELYEDKLSQTEMKADGKRQSSFWGINETDYRKISQLFSLYEFSLKDYQTSGDSIRVEIMKKNQTLELEYAMDAQNLTVIYPHYYYSDDQTMRTTDDRAGIFPELEKAFGALLPRVSNVLKRNADSKETQAGFFSETYRNFTSTDYNSFSQYLLERECLVEDYTTQDRILIISLKKANTPFTMIYDPDSRTITMKYPADSHLEQNTVPPPTPAPTAAPTPKPTAKPTVKPTAKPTMKPTAKPTATPAPTFTSDEYNTYAAIFVAIVKNTRNNPNTLQIHSIRVMEYRNDTYIVIDFSAMNGFGGYNRETYSFKFEYGRISLSGNSSDYDMYEKHKNEFSLITYLNVDAVLKLVK